jgi:hypothetical protein
MNGYRLRVWVVSCFLVSIVVTDFSYAAQSLRCLLRGWCVFGFLCRFASLCEDKKGRILREVVWMWPDVSI